MRRKASGCAQTWKPAEMPVVDQRCRPVLSIWHGFFESAKLYSVFVGKYSSNRLFPPVHLAYPCSISSASKKAVIFLRIEVLLLGVCLLLELDSIEWRFINVSREGFDIGWVLPSWLHSYQHRCPSLHMMDSFMCIFSGNAFLFDLTQNRRIPMLLLC